MKTPDSPVPDPLLETRGGGGCLVPVGMVLLAAGGLTLAGAFGLELAFFRNHGVSKVLLGVIGSVWILFGVMCVLGRSRLTIELQAGRVEKTWRLLIPVKKRVCALADVRAVRLDNCSENREYARQFRVNLVFGQGEEALLVEVFQPFAAALAHAKALCRLLDRPLEDATGDAIQVWELPFLDETLKARLVRLGQRVPEVPPPSASQVKVQAGKGVLVVEMPSLGSRQPPARIRLTRDRLELEGETAGRRARIRMDLPLAELRSLGFRSARHTFEKGRPPGNRSGAWASRLLEGLGVSFLTLTSATEWVQIVLNLSELDAAYVASLIHRQLLGPEGEEA